MAGNTYLLDFYGASDILGTASVNVGVSNSATSFGSLIYSTSFSAGGWQHLTQSFVATGTESFLTVQASVPDTYISVDNFSLTETGAGVPDTGATAGFLVAGLAALAAVRRRVQV